MPRTLVRRGRQLGRALDLLNLLSNNPAGYTMPELLERLGAKRRTVYRDLEALASAGIHLARLPLPSAGVRYRLPQEYRFIKTTFDENELFSLFFAKNLLKPLEGTPFARGMHSALDKIYRLLPADVQNYCFFTESFFLFKQPFTRSYRQVDSVILRLKEAILGDRKCAIDYQKDGSTHRHVLHPYFVTYVDGLLYVVGYSEARGERRTFRLDRIANLSLLEERFQRPQEFRSENFDAEKLLGKSFKIYSDENAELVEIEFVRELAQYVRERVWHATQRIRPGRGGRVLLSMELPANQELASWILSFGAQARVRKPAALAARISSALWKAAGMYSSSRLARRDGPNP